ncbi:MAG TPA: heme ABC exporter ATP-binding protein CcmA [Acidimicrobiales bacterium]|nr:heme ABC exporter ATP-binding protein CcmA [Acidimicrobiales bacterium]
MGPAIRLCRAVVLLGRFPALAGADLLVQRGDLVHLSGPNGAGKSTLLRACAGLLTVVEGEAEVLGHDLRRDRRRVRRSIGLLGHASFLYDELTVEDNLRFAVRAARGSVGAVEPALSRLGLDGRLRAVEVARLSAGQRRRAALAVLVARRPELWLLDEPHAGLDAAGRDVVDAVVAEAVAGGATVVFASHELDRAAALATRQLTVVGGQVHATQPFAPPARRPEAAHA